MSQCFKYSGHHELISKQVKILVGINLEVLISVYRNLEVFGRLQHYVNNYSRLWYTRVTMYLPDQDRNASRP